MYTPKSIVPLLMVFSTLLAACTSTPYTRHRSPSVQGDIFIGGEPASGLPIYLSTDGNDEQCLKHALEAVTGTQGEFSLPGVKQHMSYTPLMTHYLDEWVICVEIENRRVRLHSGNRYGMGSVTGSVTIRCRFEQGQYFAEKCDISSQVPRE